jgi:nitrile hydratase accessory protein
LSPSEARIPPDLAAAAQAVAPIPRCGSDEPVFSAPWEAQAFAMTVALAGKGLFAWGEWAQTLGQVIAEAKARGETDDGSTYYVHWLTALERLTAAKGIATPASLETRRAAWDRAARATPHGAPILLENDPSGG